MKDWTARPVSPYVKAKLDMFPFNLTLARGLSRHIMIEAAQEN